MNYANYAKHTLYTPDLYHRRFDQDLAVKDTETSWENQAKRVALAALPYVSLYRPAGSILSIGLGSYRAISHLSAAFTSENWKTELFQTALAVLSVANSIFNFTIGLALTTSIETIQGLSNLADAVYNGQYRKALEEALQVVTSAVYLGFMVSGSLEAMLGFTLLQVASSFIQAQGDFANGRYLEAASKMGMGFVRIHQATGYVQQIEKRNQLLALQKYADFLKRVLKGRAVRHILENPLSAFKDAEHAVLDELDCGAYFHGYGKGLVKGMNLAFRTKIIDGKEITELDFKVNHVFREKIKNTVDDFSKLETNQMNEILELAQSHAKGIRIEQNQPFLLGDNAIGTATKITLEGLGSIFIGSSKAFPNMYDRVVVQMETDKNLYDFHELMAFLDVDQALQISTQEDIDRLKIGHLVRIIDTYCGLGFERAQNFFDLPIDQLKKQTIASIDQLKKQTIASWSEEIIGKTFQDYFDKMTLEEILPGKMRYRVNGLAESVYDLGARGLTAAITGALSNKDLFPRIAAILKKGMLSTELRMQGNLGINGLSSAADFKSGGADSVFTQIITKNNCDANLSFYNLCYSGRARLLISLDAIETGTYQYFEGHWGTRRIESFEYISRLGILPFTEELQRNYSRHVWNEVMLKERIAPSFFTGIALYDTQTRDDLMEYLRTQNVVHLDASNHETILGIDADKFIRITDHFSEDLFSK